MRVRVPHIQSFIMPIQFTIADVLILQQDAHAVKEFVQAQPGRNREIEDAILRIEKFADSLVGIDITFQI